MNNRLFFAVLLCMTLVASCGKDEDEKSATAPDSQSVEESSALTDIITACAYSPSEFTEVMSQCPIVMENVGDNEIVKSLFSSAIAAVSDVRLYDMDVLFSGRKITVGYKRDWQVESFTFKYMSVAASGEPVELSGRVTFPNRVDASGHELTSLSLYAHYYLYHVSQAPSHVFQLQDMRALYNSAVIEPDFQGYGVTENMSYCGYSFEVQAVQMYDCIRAALEVMRRRNVRLGDNGYSTLWGYSLSSPVTMAFVRYYDQKMPQAMKSAINLKSAYMGGGPFLMDRMIQYLDEHSEFNASPAYHTLPFFSALSEKEFAPYKLEEFFPSWMKTYMVEVDGQQMSFYDAMVSNKQMKPFWPEEHTPSILANNFAEDMCDDNRRLDYSNEKTVFIMNKFHTLSDWSGWMPSVDVYITHCTSDENIPYAQAHEFYESKAASGKVHWKDISVGPLQSAMGSHKAATVLSMVYSTVNEDPAQAFRRTL